MQKRQQSVSQISTSKCNKHNLGLGKTPPNQENDSTQPEIKVAGTSEM